VTDAMTNDRSWCCTGCGTYGGYQRHKKQGDTPCGPCRIANRDYQRSRRDSDPEIRARGRRDTRTRSRALYRLLAAHPDEFHRFWLEELAKDPGP